MAVRHSRGFASSRRFTVAPPRSCFFARLTARPSSPDLSPAPSHFRVLLLRRLRPPLPLITSLRALVPAFCTPDLPRQNTMQRVFALKLMLPQCRVLPPRCHSQLHAAVKRGHIRKSAPPSCCLGLQTASPGGRACILPGLPCATLAGRSCARIQNSATAVAAAALRISMETAGRWCTEFVFCFDSLPVAASGLQPRHCRAHAFVPTCFGGRPCTSTSQTIGTTRATSSCVTSSIVRVLESVQ